MSTCPEKDLHSIYLDGEMPAAYVAGYEAHVRSCPQCAKQLEGLRILRKAFEQDGAMIALSQADMEKSFERLQARLSYSKITKPGTVLEFPKALASYIATGVAAAVMVALVLPLRLNTKSQVDYRDTQFQPVARAALVSPVSAGAIITPSAQEEASPHAITPFASPLVVSYTTGWEDEESGDDLQKAVLPLGACPRTYSAYAQAVSASRSSLASYDVFTPVYLPQDHAPKEKSMFSLKVHSLLGNVSLEIGSGN